MIFNLRIKITELNLTGEMQLQKLNKIIVTFIVSEKVNSSAKYELFYQFLACTHRKNEFSIPHLNLATSFKNFLYYNLIKPDKMKWLCTSRSSHSVPLVYLMHFYLTNFPMELENLLKSQKIFRTRHIEVVKNYNRSHAISGSFKL